MKNVNEIIDNMDEKSIKDLTRDDFAGEIDSLNLEFEEDSPSEDDKSFIKCGSNTNPNKLAWFIAKEFEGTKDCVIIQIIGPKALAKASLAIIRLKSIIAPCIDGSTLVQTLSVRKLQLGGEEKTAIRIRLFPVPNRYVI